MISSRIDIPISIKNELTLTGRELGRTLHLVHYCLIRKKTNLLSRYALDDKPLLFLLLLTASHNGRLPLECRRIHRKGTVNAL